MNKELTIKGFWWLPNSENRIAGILTYKPYEVLMLELFGTLETNLNPLEQVCNISRYNFIHGVSSVGEQISLLHCTKLGSEIPLNGIFPINRYKCDFLVIGKHIGDIDEKCYNRAVIKIPQLNSWCRSNNIQFSIDKGKHLFSFDPNNLKSIATVDINENLSIQIQSGVISSFHNADDGTECSLKDYTFVEMKCNKASLFEMYKYNFIYEQFLSLATLNYGQCSNFELYDCNDIDFVYEGHRYRKPIQFIYVQDKTENGAKSDKLNPLFDYEQIKDIYPSLLRNWYAKSEKFSPIRGHLIECIKYKTTFTELDFLIVMQAVEGFYYRFRKDGENLGDLLSKLVDEFSDIDVIRNSNIAVNALKESRHYYSHFMPEGKKKDVLSVGDLLLETFKLRILLICCALNFIGLNNKEINDILNKSNNSIIKNTYQQ
jgi:hypothetical protein